MTFDARKEARAVLVAAGRSTTTAEGGIEYVAKELQRIYRAGFDAGVEAGRAEATMSVYRETQLLALHLPSDWREKIEGTKGPARRALAVARPVRTMRDLAYARGVGKRTIRAVAALLFCPDCGGRGGSLVDDVGVTCERCNGTGRRT